MNYLANRVGKIVYVIRMVVQILIPKTAVTR